MESNDGGDGGAVSWGPEGTDVHTLEKERRQIRLCCLKADTFTLDFGSQTLFSLHFAKSLTWSVNQSQLVSHGFECPTCLFFMIFESYKMHVDRSASFLEDEHSSGPFFLLLLFIFLARRSKLTPGRRLAVLSVSFCKVTKGKFLKLEQVREVTDGLFSSRWSSLTGQIFGKHSAAAVT